jgi:hypothetical protein
MASVLTPIGILNFAALFEPKPSAKGSDKLRFSALLLFDNLAVKSSAYEALRREVYNAIVEKFGAAKANDQAFIRTLRSPFRPAAEKSYDGFDKGEIYISAWSNPDSPPSVIDLKGSKIVVPGDVWSGQLARFSVRPFAYDSNGNKGAGFYLEHVQIVKADMPRLDGRQSAEQAFSQADNSQLAALGIDPNVVAAPSAGPDAGAGAGAGGGGGLPW